MQTSRKEEQLRPHCSIPWASHITIVVFTINTSNIRSSTHSNKRRSSPTHPCVKPRSLHGCNHKRLLSPHPPHSYPTWWSCFSQISIFFTFPCVPLASTSSPRGQAYSLQFKGSLVCFCFYHTCLVLILVLQNHLHCLDQRLVLIFLLILGQLHHELQNFLDHFLPCLDHLIFLFWVSTWPSSSRVASPLLEPSVGFLPLPTSHHLLHAELSHHNHIHVLEMMECNS